MASYTWTGNGGDGNYNNPLNWSPHGVPGPADSASISLSAAGAINLDNGYGAGTLTTNKYVTLNLSNQSTFTLGSGSAGTFANGGTLALNSTNQNTDVIIGSTRESLTAFGTIVMSNNGGNRIYGAAAADTLVNVNNVIEGAGLLGNGTLTLSNGTAGKIIANDSNSLVINTGSAVVSNSGLLEGAGTGGLVLLSVVNDGASGQVTAAGGNVYLQGGDLRGGTLSSSGGAAITVQGGNTGTLDGTTNAVDNTGTVAVNNQGTLAVLGNITNLGVIALQSNNQNTDLVIGPATGAAATVDFSGAGTVLLSDNGGNRIYAAQAGDALYNGQTISGAGQLGSGTNLDLRNFGIIDATGGNTLVVNTGSNTVFNEGGGLLEATNPNGGLVLQATVNNSSNGTILANGANVYLQGADILGGLLNSSGAAISVQGGYTGTLDGTANAVTNSGTVAVNNQGTLSVLGSIVNTGLIALQSGNQLTALVVGPATGTPGTVTLSGTGTLSLSDNPSNYIYGAQAGDTLLNEQTIAGAGQFGNGTLTLINQGTIDATGGNGLVVNTGSTVVNDALMEATNPNGGLVLQATINGSGGGTLLAAGANVYLQGADIIGGTLNSSGAGAITIQGGQVATLDGSSSTVTNDNQIAINNQGTLTLLGTLVNAGTISLQSINQATEFVVGSPTLTLSGGGVVSLSDNQNNYIFGAASADVLDNVNNLIEGSGQIGNNQLTLVNAGTIAATGSYSALYLNGDTLITNTALIEATGSNGLVAENTTIDDISGGTLSAVNSNIDLQNTTVQGGLLSTTTTAAITIQGGQIATLDGSTSSVTNTGTVAINNQGTLTALGTLVNNGSILLQSINQPTEFVAGSPTLTLTGGGNVILSDNQNNYIIGATGTDVLDNVNNLIEGSGQIGDNQLTLVNAGTIDATGSYSALYLNGDTLITNTDLIEATGSAGMYIQNTTVNDITGGTLAAVNSDIYLQSSTVEGGILSTGPGAAIAIQGSNAATLDGTSSSVTNTGLVSLQNQATLTLLGTITNDGTISLGSTNQPTSLIAGSGTVTLTGSGTVTLSNNPANYIYGTAAADVLDNVNNIINGAGSLGSGQMTLINAAAGIIDANQSNTLTLNTTGETVTNAGLLEASAGGTLLLLSTRVANTGTVYADGGNISLAGGTIAGGKLSAAAGGEFVVTSNNAGTLDGSSAAVVIAGAVAVNNQATLTLLGSIENIAGIALQSSNQSTDLIIGPSSGNAGTATLFDGGTITLSDNPNNYILGGEAGDKLNIAKDTIQGAGQLGDGQLTLVNNSTIDATGSNALVLNTGSVTATNNGLMEATGGGGLVIDTAVDSSGGGTILANGGYVYLQGGTLLGGTLNSIATSINVQGGYTGGLVGTTHAVTNLGSVTLSNQGTLDISGSIVNDGTIALQSTNQNTDLVVNSTAVTLTGGGTITLSDNSGNRIYGASGSDVLDNVNNTIVGAGQIGVGQLTLTNAGTIDASGGNALVLATSGAAAINTGLMEATGSGGLVIQTAVSNKGGTILAASGNVYLQGGTVSGGTLNSATGVINVQGGNAGALAGTTSAVTNLGEVSVSNQGTLYISGAIINDGSIALQSTNQNTDLVVNSSTATLTGGGTISLTDNGGNRIYGASGTDVLDNVNDTIVGAGQLGAGELTLTNVGTIDASGGNALILNTVATSNTGLMEATGSGGLVIQTAVSNSGGSILAAGGNVYLQGGTIGGGTLNSSGGAAITVQSGYTGTLNGSAHAQTDLGSIDIYNQGTLSILGSLVNQGTIALQSTNQNTDLIIANSKVTLSGGGTVTLSDNSANRIYGAAAADELNNVSNTIEGSGQLGAGQLTLVNSGTIAATGSNALTISLGRTGVNNGTGAFIGEGSGGLAVQNGTYTNYGTIQADDGSNVTFSSGGSLTNQRAGTLVDGTFAAVSTGDGATLTAVTTSTSALTNDDANIILSGANSSISFNGKTVESTLNAISAAGTLQILGDRSYTSTLALANSGQLDLGGGVLTAKSLVDKAGSVLSGFGTIATALTEDGTLVATGGALELSASAIIAGTVSGTGTLVIDRPNIAVDSGTVLDVSTIAVINNSSLLLNSSVSFAGTFDLVGPGSLSGTGTFTNTGLFEQTGTGNAAAIFDPFSNAGTILVSSGGMSFQGGLANTGLIVDDGVFKDTAALTGGSLTVGPAGAAATIASASGAGPGTLSTLTMEGGQLNTSGTTLTVTGDYDNTVSGTGNSYKPFYGVTGTIDGQETQLAVVGVDGTTITTVNGTLTIAIAPGGSANFVIENTGPSGAAALRGALQTTVNGGHITGHALSGSGVTAGDFGPIAGGSESGTYTINYSSGSLSGEAIHLASDFANVAGLTIDIVASPQATPRAGGSVWDASVTSPELLSSHHG